MTAHVTLEQLLVNARRAHQRGERVQAERHYQQVLAAAPNHPQAHRLLGLLYTQQGRHDEAVRHLGHASLLEGADVATYTTLGEAQRQQGKLEAALVSFNMALLLEPDQPDVCYSLATIFAQLGQLEQAIVYFRRAIGLRPTFGGAHFQLGNALLDQGQFAAAAAAYRQALRLRPDDANAHHSLGAVSVEQGRLDDAVAHYRRATVLQPSHAAAQRDLANVLERQGRVDEAVASYARATQLDPQNDALRLASETIAAPVWNSNAAIGHYRATLETTLAHHAAHGLRLDPAQLHQSGGEPPRSLIYHGLDDQPLKRRYAALFAPSFAQELRASHGEGVPHIGYFVPHGQEAIFLKGMRGIIERLPAHGLRVSIICSRRGGEALLRRAIANPAVRMLGVPPRVDQAAAVIRAARVDLLLYWAIGSDTASYFLPFYRLAPVQCGCWGYPVTSGIPQIDYFLSSALLEPPDAESHYSERLVRLSRLPTFYYRPQMPPVVPPRARWNLSEQARLYLCTQNLRKVHPDFDQLIAEILRCDERALVLLLEDAQLRLGNMLRHRWAASIGDVAHRIRILPRLGAEDYLALISLADVVLDTLHYGGGANTTYDALAVCTPIVTLPTRYARGRYAAAAYQQMGLPDAVAQNAEAYVAMALRLANDPQARAERCAQIAQTSHVLFEDQRVVEELAAFFTQAIAAHRV